MRCKKRYLSLMKDSSDEPVGHVVRVTTPGHWSAAPTVEFYDVAVPSPRAAEFFVSELIKAIDQRVEALEPLSQSVASALGLTPGQIRKRL